MVSLLQDVVHMQTDTGYQVAEFTRLMSWHCCIASMA